MSRMTNVVLFVALLAGCSSIPANVAVNIEQHDSNVVFLHDDLIARLDKDLVAAEEMLLDEHVSAEDKVEWAEAKENLLRALALAKADKLLSKMIKDWGMKLADADEVAEIRAAREAAAGN